MDERATSHSSESGRSELQEADHSVGKAADGVADAIQALASEFSQEPFRSLTALTSIAALLTSLVAVGVLSHGELSTQSQRLSHWVLTHQGQLRPTVAIYAGLIMVRYGRYPRGSRLALAFVLAGIIMILGFMWVGGTELLKDSFTGSVVAITLAAVTARQWVALPELLRWFAGTAAALLIGVGIYTTVALGPRVLDLLLD